MDLADSISALTALSFLIAVGKALYAFRPGRPRPLTSGRPHAASLGASQRRYRGWIGYAAAVITAVAVPTAWLFVHDVVGLAGRGVVGTSLSLSVLAFMAVGVTLGQVTWGMTRGPWGHRFMAWTGIAVGAVVWGAVVGTAVFMVADVGGQLEFWYAIAAGSIAWTLFTTIRLHHSRRRTRERLTP